MNLAIGADHRGYNLKEKLYQWLSAQQVHVIDVGCYTAERCDYPLFALEVCQLVRTQQVAGGILLCGSGIGMSIAANRIMNIYAALVWDPVVARRSKEEDYANIVVLPADYLSFDHARACVQAWLSATPRPDERYAQRLALLETLTKKYGAH